MELQPEVQSRCLHFLRGGLSKSGIGRVDQQGHDARRWDQLVQQLQPFWRYPHVRIGHARNVAARPVKAGDEPEPDRVAACFKDDRNRLGCRLCRKRRRSASRRNHSHPTMNQISHHRRQPIISALRPAVFDRHVLAFDVTGFAQPFEKGRQLSRITFGRSEVDKPDHRHRRLLRARSERPCCRSSAEKRDELASLHVSPVRTTPCAIPKA